MTYPSDPITLSDPPKLRIGCVHRLRHFPYWAILAQGINARAAELGIELCLPTADADLDWEAPVMEVIRQRPSVVILPHSVNNAFPAALRTFTAADIPVIGVEMAPTEQCASVVRADEAQGAATIVAHLFELIGGQGKVANICGSGITQRQFEFHKLLRQYPKIELAYESEGEWTRESGARAMRAALSAHPDLRGVFAHNDPMAIGAIEAIAACGLGGQIVVVGFDADPEGLIEIREGRLAATIYRGMYGVGVRAVDMALSVARGEQLPPELRIPTRLIVAANLIDATLDTTYILPQLLRDLVESSRIQRRLQQETIDAQRAIIHDLSTPILPISDSIVIMPLIGSIDNVRAQLIMETMLQAIGQYNARYLIIDITGIAVVDTAIAHHLIQAARAVELLGAHAILVGIGPEVAQTLIGLGVDFGAITTRATLQVGFEYAQRSLAPMGRSIGTATLRS